MRIPLAFLAIFCGVLFVAGSLSNKEKLKISYREEGTRFDVMITLFSITPEYRWLSVYGCSAAIYEHGTFCTGDFERESTQEVRQEQNQYPFPWRNMPGGTLQITAVAFDQDGKPLAKGQKTVPRVR